ncbi:MAG: hypothetical protein EKK52_07780 [Burkholderiales bacterium]|nr:MAG: hypothetical protein EKK52_07780 [Burkholderiales bacterium]
MEIDKTSAGSRRRRGRTQFDGDLKTPVPPVPAVTLPSARLTTGDITAKLRDAEAPLPALTRENNGRFRRGAPSPNPGGRPAIAPEVRDAARAYTAEMLGVLVNVAMDEGAPAAARVTAATAVLDRGHGKPVTNVDARVATVDIGAMHLEALREMTGLGTTT